MKFIVTAIGFDPANPTEIIGPRDEVIDTQENELFRDCHSEWAVEDRYEAVWNRLNDHWEQDFPRGKEKVKVVKVVAASKTAMDYLQKIKTAAFLCDDIEDVEDSEYVRGISEFIAKTEDLDAGSIRRDLEKYIPKNL